MCYHFLSKDLWAAGLSPCYLNRDGQWDCPLLLYGHIPVPWLALGLKFFGTSNPSTPHRLHVPIPAVFHFQLFCRLLGTHRGKKIHILQQRGEMCNSSSSQTFGICEPAHMKSFSRHRHFSAGCTRVKFTHSKLGVETPVSTLDICRLVRNRAAAIKHSSTPKKNPLSLNYLPN